MYDKYVRSWYDQQQYLKNVHVHKAKILGEWYDLELDEEDSQGMGEGDGE